MGALGSFPRSTGSAVAWTTDLLYDGTFLNITANADGSYTGYYVDNFGTGAAHAIYQAAVPAGGGDCFLLLQTDYPALVQYALGLDNSDDDSYKLTVKGAGASVLPGDATGINIFRVDRTTGDINFDRNIQWKSGTAFTGTLDHAITADRIWIFPNAPGTVAVSATSPATLSALGDVGFDQAIALGNNARVAVSKNSGAVVGTRREINFIEGSGVTLTVADDAGNEEVDVTIAAAGGSEAAANTVLRFERFY
jgi:hypothetical protein